MGHEIWHGIEHVFIEQSLVAAFAVVGALILVSNRAAKYLSIGIASLANVLNPEMVILGGGLIEALGDPYVQRVRQELEGRPMLAATLLSSTCTRGQSPAYRAVRAWLG